MTPEQIALRDHFAGLAMAELVSWETEDADSAKAIAIVAYQQADAMLAQRLATA